MDVLETHSATAPRVLAVACGPEALAHLRLLVTPRAAHGTPLFSLSHAETTHAALAMLSGFDVCVLARGDAIDEAGLAAAGGDERQQAESFVRSVSEAGVPLLVLAEAESTPDDRALMGAGAVDYLVRAHINAPLFERALRYAIEGKRVEDELRRSQERLVQLSDNVPGVVYRWKMDAAGHMSFTFLSEGARDIFGPNYTRLIGQDARTLIEASAHIEEHAAFWESIHASARTMSPWQWLWRTTSAAESTVSSAADNMSALDNTMSSATGAMSDAEDAVSSAESIASVAEDTVSSAGGAVGVVEGMWLDCRARPSRQGDGSILWDGVMLDVTARVRVEEELRQARAEIERRVERRTRELALANEALQAEAHERGRAESKLRSRARQQEAIAMISQRALQGVEMPVLLRGVASLIAATLDVEMASVVRNGGHSEQEDFGVARDRDVDAVASLPFAPDARALLGHVLRTGEPGIIDDWAAQDRYTVAESVGEKGIRSSVFVPIPGGGSGGSGGAASDAFGVLAVHSMQPARFSIEEVSFLAAIAHVLATAIDRRRLEGALGESRARLQAVLDNTTNMIYLKDMDGRHILSNRTLEEMHAEFYPQAPPLIGSSDRDFLSPRNAASIQAHDAQVLADGQARTFEEFLDQGDGPNGRRYFLSAKFPLFDQSGAISGIGGISTDITERKTSELARDAAHREAERARQEADRANAAKSEFLSRMSHELRTPLNAILGFAQLLELSALPERSAQGVRQILKAGRHLLTLINEVLDIARIESGRLATSIEPVPLRPLLEEVTQLIAPLAVAKNISLKMVESGDCSQMVMADRQRLIQILLNLISNAVKYNRPGGQVHVSCTSVGGGEGKDRARILVTDTGEGIAPEKLERLWTPFDRLDAESSGVEGTGLGLPLSRALAQSMNGRLHVESRPGHGSTFCIELDAALPQASHAPSGPEQPTRTGEASATVLYIEDNSSNVLLVEGIFKHRPHLRLVSARTGGDGLQMASSLVPRLVLLDLDLPDIHGLSVLESLRQNHRTRAIPVVIVSADATRSQIARVRQAGALDYLTKPLDVPRLLQLLDGVLGPDGAARDGGLPG